MSELKQKTVKGVVWSAIERFSVQGIQFVVMIFMARMLTPDDYGLVGMLAVFIAISQSFVDSGFSQALIRKPIFAGYSQERINQRDKKHIVKKIIKETFASTEKLLILWKENK